MKLRITAGPGNGQLYTFPDHQRILVGRDMRCNLCLRDEKCSRQQFEIYADDDQICIRDLNSANGTRLNNIPLDKSELHLDDVIQAGSTTLLVLEIERGQNRKRNPQLTFQDSGSEVVFSLPQTDASLLALRGGSQPIVDLERENTVLREVCEMCQVIATSDDDSSITDTLVARALGLLEADGVCYIEPTEADEEWTVRSSASSSERWNEVIVSQTIIQLALQKNISILSSDPMHDQRFDPGKSIVLQRITSAICSPLLVDDTPFGVLFIVRRSRAESFNEFDLRVAATLANLLALYLRKSRLESAGRERNRLAVIGEVVAGLAHFAKNILMGLDFSLANLETSAEDQDYPKIKEGLKSVSVQQQRLSNLVHDMLNYAKERVPDRTPTDLAKVFGESMTPYAWRMGQENIQLDLNIDPDLPLVHADENALVRVFLNLITNAMDAVTSPSVRGEKRIKVDLHVDPQASDVIITFADTGEGISATDLANIFDVLYSTKGSKGTGIGLAVVRKIISEHNGQIDVQSTPGNGTTFTLRLPIAAPTPKME